MADAQDILDQLADPRDPRQRRQRHPALGGSPRSSCPSRDDQYLVVWSDKRDTWVKRHLTDQTEVSVLVAQNTLQRAPASLGDRAG